MKKKSFTLMEIMMVVAIVGILLAIAAPNWSKQRENSNLKLMETNISMVTLAKERYQLDTGVGDGSRVSFDNLKRYLPTVKSLDSLDVGGKDLVIADTGEEPYYQ